MKGVPMDKTLNFQHTKPANQNQPSSPSQDELELISGILSGGLIKATLPDFLIYYFNNGFCQLTGYSKEECRKNSVSKHYAFIHPQDLDELQKIFTDKAETKLPISLEFRIIKKDEEVCWVQLNGAYLEEHEGKPAYLCLLMDVSKIHACEEQHDLDQQRSSIVTQLSSSSFWEYNFSTECMARYGDLSQTYSPEPVIYNWTHYVQENEIIYHKDFSRFQSIFSISSPKSGFQSVDIRMKNHLGIYKWYKLKYKLLFNQSKEPVKIFGQIVNLEVPDIQAATSVSLLEKTAFIKKVNRTIQQGAEDSNCGLMLISLSRFREYKKTYGSAFCQNLIHEFSLNLFEHFSENIIGHLGNGRFTVFFSGFTDKDSLTRQAESFLSSLENLYIGQTEYNITCNIGLVLGDKNNSNYDILYKKACISLDTAERNGNRTYDIYGFQPGKNQKSLSGHKPSLSPAAPGLPYHILQLGISLACEEKHSGSLEDFLAMIGKYYHGTHVIFMENHFSSKSSQIASQWHAANAASFPAISYPLKEMEACYPLFDEHNCLICENLSLLEEKAPLFYESLQLEQIPTILLYALHQEQENIGFLGLTFPYPLSKAFDFPSFQIIGNLAKQIATKRRMENFSNSFPIDQITNLPSFHHFLKKGKYILAENPNEHFALVYLDINNFHTFNHNFGFGVGNHILERFGLSLQNTMGKKELCCRVERDHFALLLHYEEEHEIIERLSRRVRNPLLRPVGTIPDIYRFDTAYGVYFIPQGKTEIAKMLDYANAARKSIKGFTGSHYACYTPHLSDAAYYHETTIEKLALGLVEKKFFPLYQPRYSLADGRLVGAEALAHWKKSPHFSAPPSDFLSLMEETGMVVDMDFQIIEHVCQFLKERMQAHLSWVPISVNLSKLHLKTSNFIERLLELLSSYEIPVDCIKLEIGEDVLVRFPEEAEAFINELKSYNFFITIDHFGEMYSPLILLKNIHVDAVKLNIRAFCGQNPAERDWLVLKKVIETAIGMGTAVYAINVEELFLEPKLKELGCNEIQGPLYFRTLSRAALEELIPN